MYMDFALGLDDDFGYDGEEESSRSQNPIVGGMIDAAAGKIDALTNSNDSYYTGEGRSGKHTTWQDQVDKRGKEMQAQKAAADKFKNSEKNASGTGASTNNALGGLSNAKNAEQNSENGFSANVVGKVGEKAVASKVPGGKKIAANLKKMGPFGSILLVLIGFAALLSGSQSLAPFGFVSNGLDQFNSLRTAMNKRSTYFSRFMLDNTRNKPITRATIFGNEKFKISPIMERRLAKHNITYVDDAVGVDGKKVRMLVYTDPDTGETMGIATKQADVDNMPGRVTTPDGVEVEINSKVRLDDAMVGSKNFSNSLDRATRTIKGHVAGWFDSGAEILLSKFTSRHRFSGDDTDGKKSDDEIVEEARKGNKRSEDLDGNVSGEGTDDTKPQESTTRTDAETGEVTTSSTPIDPETGTGSTKAKGGDINTKISEVEGVLSSKISIASAAAGAGNIGCAILKAYGALNAAIAAIQIANVINFATGFLEAVQKAQAGDGGAELHYYMALLSAKAATYLFNHDGKKEIVRENTSSLMSDPWNSVFGGIRVSPNDSIAMTFNREYATTNAFTEKTRGIFSANSDLGESVSFLNNYSNSVDAFKKCNGIQVAGAVADIVGDVVTLVASIFTFGGATVAKVVGSMVKDWLQSAVISAIIGSIMLAIQSLVPHIAAFLMEDYLVDKLGEKPAYMILDAISKLGKDGLKNASGRPGTINQVRAEYRDTQEILARDAEFDRSTKSPFDVTSKYTFMGSLINQLTPLANSLSSPLSVMSNTVNLIGDAVTAISPTAKAAGEVEFMGTLNEDCPALRNLGLVGDAFCNAYYVSGYTIGTNAAVADSDYYSSYIPSNYSKDPADVFEDAAVGSDGGDNFDFNADSVNPPIKKDSELAKYVIACEMSESQPGEVDSNTLNAIAYTGANVNTGSSIADVGINSAIGSLPLMGIDDLVAAIDMEKELPFASQENCTKMTKYAQYSEDQRVLEGMGLIEKSQVTAFMEDYYEENPLDDSTEGIIARYSGMTKEQARQTLSLIEYANYVYSYNPSDKGPVKHDNVRNDWQYESNEIVADNIVYKGNTYIIYFDIRNRATITS